MALSKSVMRNVARFRIRGHGLKCETALYGRSPDRSARVCNLCENGDIFKMRNTLFFHVLCHSKSLSLQSIRLSTTIYIGFKPGSSLSRAKAGNCTTDCNSPDNLSLSFSAVSQIRLT